jgi:hypothetical protein
MWLIVDDERSLGCEIIARTVDVGLRVLLAIPEIECLCIDHDLGDENPRKTGLYVVREAIASGCLPNRVQIVTQNPVGKQNIQNALKDHGYHTVDNINFYKLQQEAISDNERMNLIFKEIAESES